MTPVLWSFRRCPYAMRARLAIAAARQVVETREILLRDKPDAFLAVSPSATVPCLVLANRVIDESRDIMVWALQQHDPQDWLDMPAEGHDLIARNDGPFKQALDRTKYANRYPDSDPYQQREIAAEILHDLNRRLQAGWLFGRVTLADIAILPFVRQFAQIDRTWFDAQDWPDLRAWLDVFTQSQDFARIMTRRPIWSPDVRS
ncbi:glutathione S-transferase [Loktanella sp. 3ANDIMAR09]|uniref:glutathione S-transferase n=1 Tax=Loktanella sp. 3ANDIMAR09 TaxID=1225657 RepID=UPI0006FB44FF|nr:glutathione S-transferase [Loktanella sp. 3ANDIMAR09]KQI69519.1 glutathione S-transferase [Loktanella sp. 3ANDIMAR09]